MKGREVNAVYLSRENLEIIEHDDVKQSITLCDVVPILLPDDSSLLFYYDQNKLRKCS